MVIQRGTLVKVALTSVGGGHHCRAPSHGDIRSGAKARACGLKAFTGLDILGQYCAPLSAFSLHTLKSYADRHGGGEDIRHFF